MANTVIKNIQLVNEGKILEADLRIKGQRIDRIAPHIAAQKSDNIVDGNNRFLLPGMIDDQVHFREPGLTHKGTIASESRAALAGGITSYMEMPNVDPSTTTISALEKKFSIAQKSSAANYSFYLGATENNIKEIKALNPAIHCGLKVFMGASTGNLLVEDHQSLHEIFAQCPTLIVTHCENGDTIRKNLQVFERMGVQPEINDHASIRSSAACFESSSLAVSLAKELGSQLHVLHISTKDELKLFSSGPIQKKRITAEACVHHLWFNQNDYSRLGNLIKCNPSIKSAEDQHALIKAVNDGTIDIIATDHAPHTWEEKLKPYPNAPAGLPLVQHALLSLMDHVNEKRIELCKVVEKVAHNPAIRYKIIDRGFLREGYFADMVLLDLDNFTSGSHTSSHYHCKWTPFNGHKFSSRILKTWVNGLQVFDGKQISLERNAHRLMFNP